MNGLGGTLGTTIAIATILLGCGSARTPPDDPECGLSNATLADDVLADSSYSGGFTGGGSESVLLDGSVLVSGPSLVSHPSLGQERYDDLLAALDESGVYDELEGCYGKLDSSGEADGFDSVSLFVRDGDRVLRFSGGEDLPDAVSTARGLVSKYVQQASAAAM
jgi:hypothetical protein